MSPLKVEVFEHSLENTHGDDLAKILLLKAPSSEVWFDRRTNFTRSLAVMSMVGYVLGLGDRHGVLEPCRCCGNSCTKQFCFRILSFKVARASVTNLATMGNCQKAKFKLSLLLILLFPCNSSHLEWLLQYN